MGGVVIIGGADAPTFAFLLWEILKRVLMSCAAVAVISVIMLLIVWLIKKGKNSDTDKKD